MRLHCRYGARRRICRTAHGNGRLNRHELPPPVARVGATCIARPYRARWAWALPDCRSSSAKRPWERSLCWGETCAGLTRKAGRPPHGRRPNLLHVFRFSVQLAVPAMPGGMHRAATCTRNFRKSSVLHPLGARKAAIAFISAVPLGAPSALQAVPSHFQAFAVPLRSRARALSPQSLHC